MSNSARLITSPPSSGSWNMAVDQALLDLCEQVPVLRFYRWDRPTLSLGYFQKFAQRSGHTSSVSCPMLRRSTGGGAIVHDQELTYSLQVPSALVPQRSAELYDIVHDSFCDWLSSHGVAAHSFSPDLIHSLDLVDQKAFLCFQRRAVGDVVGWTSPALGTPPVHQEPGQKLLGSAQRKQKNALLQHGSILLRRSEAAPELNGLLDLPSYCGQNDLAKVIGEVSSHLQENLSQRLNWDFQLSDLTEMESSRAKHWLTERFENPSWNHSR